MIFSIPYLLLVTFYGLMALWYKQTKKNETRSWNIALCILVTLLFWGFRGFCFYDWMSYYPMFLNSRIENLSDNLTKCEPGFCLLMSICKEVCDSYTFFAFACTAINVTLLSRFLIKHTDNYPLSLLISTVFGCFFLFTDLMRNAIAIFIFINAIDFMAERKCAKYFTLVIFSMSFHYSAILFLPLYFFACKKTSKKVFGILFFIGIFMYALHISLFTNLSSFILGFINSELEGKVHYYLEETTSTSKLNFVFMEQFVTGTLVLCYMDKLREIRKNANIYINCILMFFILTFYLHEFVTLSVRLAILFGVGYWIIWTDLIKCFKYTSNRRLFLAFICIYCFLRILGHTSNALANYDNVLFGAESYQQRESMFNKIFKN